jgi:hypothetical protein
LPFCIESVIPGGETSVGATGVGITVGGVGTVAVVVAAVVVPPVVDVELEVVPPGTTDVFADHAVRVTQRQSSFKALQSYFEAVTATRRL